MFKRKLFFLVLLASVLTGCTSSIDTGTGSRVPAGFPADHPEQGL